MGRKAKKRLLCYFLLTAAFLAAIPAAAFRAGTARRGAPSDYEEYYLGENATVESVREFFQELYRNPDGSAPWVFVTGEDGTMRESGPVLEGDYVAITDSQGNLIHCYRNVRPPDEESSAPASSSEPSAEPSSSSGDGSPDESGSSRPGSAPSGPSSVPAPADGDDFLPGRLSGDGYFLFEEPVTVEALEDRIAEAGTPDAVLRVTSDAGAARESGFVCTGDALTVLGGDGSLQDRITAVIPGDLTRCGGATQEGCRLFYDYLTGRRKLRGDVLRAADLDGDGEATTGDLLELKKILAEAA